MPRRCERSGSGGRREVVMGRQRLRSACVAGRKRNRGMVGASPWGKGSMGSSRRRLQQVVRPQHQGASRVGVHRMRDEEAEADVAAGGMPCERRCWKATVGDCRTCWWLGMRPLAPHEDVGGSHVRCGAVGGCIRICCANRGARLSALVLGPKKAAAACSCVPCTFVTYAVPRDNKALVRDSRLVFRI